MLNQLAEETSQHHACADGDRLSIMENSTVGRYRAFLGNVYGFEAAIEAAWIVTPGLEPRIVRSHLKSHRLAGDLRALGVAPERTVPFGPIQFASAAEALGWMWVIHRNTLVHGLSLRYLQGRLPDCTRTAASYLSAFEGRAGLLMRELGHALGDAGHRISVASEIVAAANAAFRAQRHWYNRDELAPRRPARITDTQRAA